MLHDFLTLTLRLRNDLYCVEWGVKLYSLTHLTLTLMLKNGSHVPESANRKRITVTEKSHQLVRCRYESMDDAETTLPGSAFQILVKCNDRSNVTISCHLSSSEALPVMFTKLLLS